MQRAVAASEERILAALATAAARGGGGPGGSWWAGNGGPGSPSEDSATGTYHGGYSQYVPSPLPSNSRAAMRAGSFRFPGGGHEGGM